MRQDLLFLFTQSRDKLRYLPNTDSILVSDHFTLWSFHNRVTTSLCWLSFFPQQEDNHYSACARSSDIPNQPPVIISFLPSAAQVARLIFSIFFELNHLNSPVGRHWDIAKPIKVISVQVHNIHWWFWGNHIQSFIYYWLPHVGWQYMKYHHAYQSL